MTGPVLIVEDDDDVREATRMVLETAGFPVVDAADGQQALERIHQGPKPSLVLLDLMMPGMTGSEVSASLRRNEETAAIPIVVFTGDVGGPEVARALRADACLRKPVEREDLLRTVRRFA